MELRVLRYFLTVANEGNVTKAAEILNITQPTVSRQIAEMENEMGVRLFDRSTRKVVLTKEGSLLYRRAKEILELADKTEKEIVLQDKKVAGTVSIGCGDLASVQVLSELIETFHGNYPAVSFDLYTATADHIKERMDRGLTDVGLLLEPINMEKYDYVRLGNEEEWVVAMHPDSPLAKLESISPEDLRDVPLILPRRLSIQSELARWFGDEYENLNVLFTSNLSSSSSVMVHQRLAYSIIIKGSISFWDPRNLVYRPLEPRLTSTCVLAWKQRQPFSQATDKFIGFLKGNID